MCASRNGPLHFSVQSLANALSVGLLRQLLGSPYRWNRRLEMWRAHFLTFHHGQRARSSSSSGCPS